MWRTPHLSEVVLLINSDRRLVSLSEMFEVANVF